MIFMCLAHINAILSLQSADTALFVRLKVQVLLCPSQQHKKSCDSIIFFVNVSFHIIF